MFRIVVVLFESENFTVSSFASRKIVEVKVLEENKEVIYFLQLIDPISVNLIM